MGEGRESTMDEGRRTTTGGSRRATIRAARRTRLILCALILFSMEYYSDLDTSSKSEYESDEASTLGFDYEDDLIENLEPEQVLLQAL